MSRNIVVILIIAILVASITGFYYYVKQYTPEYSWTENYKKNNDQPYGLNLFYDFLEDQENEITTISRSFNETLDTTVTNTNYLVFGRKLYFDSLRAYHILKYVENGNTALIAANQSPLEIICNIVPITDTIYDYDFSLDSVINVSMEGVRGKLLKFHHQYLKDTTSYYWSVYDNVYFNDTLSDYGLKALSFLNNKVNSFYFDYGKGKVIIHANPILFTNYNLIQKNGLTNANHILSHLNDGEIYWDVVSQRQNFNSNLSGESLNNPLQFLFSHYTLRWGWYLFLIALLIYLLFRTKREQRIIPILQKNTNSTIAYTKAIGVLYFQKGEHKFIGTEMHTLFLADLRARYNIITTIEEPALINQVSIKSGVEEVVINKLFLLFRKVRYSPMANSKDLINLHNAIAFYHKNKK